MIYIYLLLNITVLSVKGIITNKNYMNTDKEELETLVSVLKKIGDEGYTTQFKATEKGLVSLTSQKVFQPEEIKVNNFYRFEGESNPDDNAIVYAIETNDGEKGSLIDAYGNYSDVHVANFMKQVEEIHKEKLHQDS